MPSSTKKQIQDNIDRHERIADTYVHRHAEIYNNIEQQRLHAILSKALASIQTETSHIHALDLGCGAGNLTRHLVALGCRVTAADVTPSFVDLVVKEHPDHVTGLILNGVDLANVPEASLDIVATYSVLHHIPDYLATVREMARVVKPGGVVFIDHEWSASRWDPSADLLQYRSLTPSPRDARWYLSRILRPRWWHTRWKQLFDKRYQEEGDIHVWPDDHIDWQEITQVLTDCGCQIVDSRSYLLYEPHVEESLYHEYKDRCADMQYCIARKL